MHFFYLGKKKTGAPGYVLEDTALNPE